MIGAPLQLCLLPPEVQAFFLSGLQLSFQSAVVERQGLLFNIVSPISTCTEYEYKLCGKQSRIPISVRNCFRSTYRAGTLKLHHLETNCNCDNYTYYRLVWSVLNMLAPPKFQLWYSTLYGSSNTILYARGWHAVSDTLTSHFPLQRLGQGWKVARSCVGIPPWPTYGVNTCQLPIPGLGTGSYYLLHTTWRLLVPTLLLIYIGIGYPVPMLTPRFSSH